jgi:AraC-like DNA-binding protein
MTAKVDPIERAHLLDSTGFSPPIHRYAPSPGLDGLIRRFWVPIWDLPEGAVSRQRVLQYPVCQLVIAPDYARIVGPRRGMSVKDLSGRGWAFGVMLQPATGWRLLQRPMTAAVDHDIELAEVGVIDAARLVAGVRDVLTADPAAEDAHERARVLTESALTTLLPIRDADLLVNAVVDYLENAAEVDRVAQVCDKFELSERTLQRLLAKRVGLSPRWLIKRRRLYEAAGRLAEPEHPPLARLASELGYADQAHFHRDFRAVTGLTPTQYAAEPRPRRHGSGE